MVLIVNSTLPVRLTWFYEYNDMLTYQMSTFHLTRTMEESHSSAIRVPCTPVVMFPMYLAALLGLGESLR